MTYRARCLVAPGGCPRELLEALVPDGVYGEHRYEPHGESVYRLGGSITAIIHTWPEFEVATVDIHSAHPVDPVPLLAEHGWKLTTSEIPGSRNP